MKVEFEANTITYETNVEEECYMIGFSDNGDDPDEYVIIERAITFDKQDIELGMNTYYFEYSDQSGYGICENVRIETNKVIFDLKKNTLDDIESIEITFEQEKSIEDWNEFKNVFDKIFA